MRGSSCRHQRAQGSGNLDLAAIDRVMRGCGASNGVSEPLAASVESAPVISAAWM